MGRDGQSDGSIDEGAPAPPDDRSSHDEAIPRRAGAPSRADFRVACVTGTNGKTTTTTMIEAIVGAAGEPTARLTTLGSWVQGEQLSTEPTPEAFARTVAAARAARVKTLVIETTSQALAGGFARDWPADVGVFTNLTRDHLDYHGTPEHYLAAKAQLFMNLVEGGAAVLNAADPSSALLDEVAPPHARRLAYAARPPAPECAALPLALRAEHVEVSRTGTHVRLAPSPLADALGGAFTVPIVGHVHAENALAAALAGHALGYPAAVIRAALVEFAGVPGRFEVVKPPPEAAIAGAPTVVVDFAHTPDALERTLALARALVAPEKGRVLLVFGCGGDRDRGKRAEMGRVASRAAEVVIVTTDNPRSESPDAIAAAIMAGMEGRFGKRQRILDRASAIQRALQLAEIADIVVIAGKGHERTQTFRDRVVPFDDVQVARSALARRGGDWGRKRRT